MSFYNILSNVGHKQGIHYLIQKIIYQGKIQSLKSHFLILNLTNIEITLISIFTQITIFKYFYDILN